MILELHKSSIYLIVAIFSSVVVETVLLIKNVCKVKVCQRLLGHHGGWANVMDSFLSVDGSTANSGPLVDRRRGGGEERREERRREKRGEERRACEKGMPCFGQFHQL